MDCLGHTDVEFLNQLPNKKTADHWLLEMKLISKSNIICWICRRGLTVNTSVTVAIGEGILLSKNASSSTEILTKEWAKYLFKRVGLVKRKGNTKAKVDVEKFDEIKKAFLQDITSVITMDEVPEELIINWDQIGIRLVPVSEWTMEQEVLGRFRLMAKMISTR